MINNLFILSRGISNHYTPKNTTAIMRIWETDIEIDNSTLEFKNFTIFNYVFDDVDSEQISYPIVGTPNMVTLKGITKEIADQIKQDFESIMGKVETLIVNCHAGISRSPAVALALNDVYKLNLLDDDEFRCMGRYSSYNKFVYAKITKIWDYLKEEDKKN